MNGPLSRRGFLRQSFAFSALVSLGSLNSCSNAGSTLAQSLKTNSVNWLMIGDWGSEHPAGQEAVAEGMRTYVKQHAIQTDALLMLGDNWYGDLPGGVDCPRWKTHFEDLYPQSIFNCPAYAIPGNHDYQRMPESKVDAELAYAKRGSTRWTMPARWYSFTFPAKDPLVTVVALDSNVSYGKIPSPTSETFTLTPDEEAEELRWLKAELQKPRKTPYLIVMAHHPIYSNGPHGDHSVLTAEWDPLLREHGAHLYLAGHDHDMQHLEFEGHPTSFVMSGGGGAGLYNLKVDEAKRGPYAAKVHGFSHLQITEDKLTLLHLDQTGQVLHGFTKTPDGRVTIL